MNDWNVIIDGRKVFDQSVENYLEIYHNIQKVESGPGNDYTTGCSLDYPYLKKYYKMIAIVLSK